MTDNHDSFNEEWRKQKQKQLHLASTVSSDDEKKRRRYSYSESEPNGFSCRMDSQNNDVATCQSTCQPQQSIEFEPPEKNSRMNLSCPVINEATDEDEESLPSKTSEPCNETSMGNRNGHFLKTTSGDHQSVHSSAVECENRMDSAKEDILSEGTTKDGNETSKKDEESDSVMINVDEVSSTALSSDGDQLPPSSTERGVKKDHPSSHSVSTHQIEEDYAEKHEGAAFENVGSGHKQDEQQGAVMDLQHNTSQS